MNKTKRLIHSKPIHWFCYIAAVLLVLRILAPTVIENIANQSLERAPGISGSIKDVDLHLYRGAYEIEGIELRTVKNEKEYPFVEIKEVDISIFWSKLLRGQLVTELILKEPVFTFADVKEKDSDDDKYDPIAEEKTWLGIRRDLIPFELDRLEIINGTVQFEGKSVELGEKGEFYVNELNGVTVGLTTRGAENEVAPGRFDGYAMVYGESKATLEGSFDMFSKKPVFDLNASVDRVPAKNVDALIRIYAPFDIEAGSFNAATELKADQGELSGYIKVGAEDLDIFSWRQDVEKDNDNPFELLTDAVIGGVSELLTNRGSDMIATRIPIEGSLNQPETSLFDAFTRLLENAFINAVNMKIDNILSFGNDNTKDNTTDQGDKNESPNKSKSKS